MAFRTERVFILAALLFIGLAVDLALNGGLISEAPGAPTALGWLMAAALVLLAGAGARWLRGGAQVSQGVALDDLRLPVVRLPLDAVAPGLMVAGFAVFLQLFETGPLQALILCLAAVSFGGVYWAQAHAVNPQDRYFGLAQTVLNVISHLIAFLVFSVVYGLKTRALFSASAVGLVSALLIYEMLARDSAWHRAMQLPTEGRRGTPLLLSLAAGLVMAELTWGLNYWAALTTLVGGAFLLVVFYVIYGLASHYVEQKLTTRVLLEFAVVGAVGLVVIFASAFFS